jgi:hypothetical protein
VGWCLEGVAAFLVSVAVATPVFGALLDRRGICGPSLVPVILFAGLMALMSRVSSAPVYVGLFALMGLVSGGASPTSYSIVTG